MPSTIELSQAEPIVGSADDCAPRVHAATLLSRERGSLVDTVRAACLDTGFFYIDLTPAQLASVAGTLEQMRRFFALDDTDRRKCVVEQDAGGAGWVPRYTEPAYQPGTVASVEAFDCALVNFDENSGRWPRLPGFRRDVHDCWKDFDALGAAVLELLARAAGIEPDCFVRRCDTGLLNKMRLLHYAAGVADVDDGVVGIAAHTDFECITLLYQTTPGLELRNVRGQWLDAPTREDQVIVLLGDMLERWTNGFYLATGHRVRNTEQRRFSIVMFLAANEDIEVAPLADFVSVDRPAAYAPVRQATHIDAELKRAAENAKKRR